jgi:hypothetical protein
LLLRGEEGFESLDMETTSRVRVGLNLPNPGVEKDGKAAWLGVATAGLNLKFFSKG